MSITKENTRSLSIVRTYWRTVAFLVLLLMVMIFYRRILQNLSLGGTKIPLEFLTSPGLLLDLGMFVAVLIFLHLLWALIIAVSCLPFFKRLADDNTKTLVWLTIMFLHITVIFIANAYFYPTSLLGFWRDSWFCEPYILAGGTLFLSVLFICGLYEESGLFATLVVALLLTFALVGNNDYESEPITYRGNKPNVVIIGVDALRPDHMAYRGHSGGLTPELDRLFAESIVYDNTYSPMGRTYVAWMSVLKGQYPTTHGARFNLSPPELVNHDVPLLSKLRKNNYRTTYAIDERRFNQIDQSYGFDQVVGPKIGAADVVITHSADFPLINLMSNTLLAKYFLPYIYINRSNGRTYDMGLFNHEITSSLATNQPNFLAVHFCLLHWPYSSKKFVDIEPGVWQGNYNHFMYQALLKRVDVQIGNLMDDLKHRGILENAIVFIMSDHGDSFNLNEDKLLNSPKKKNSHVNLMGWGHGTNVLNQSQANVVMAYSRYKDGNVISTPAKVNGLFSLVDIVPTIFRELKLELATDEKPFDGEALPVNNSFHEANRMVYVESSLPVKSINASVIRESKVLSETASLYEIRRNGTPAMKPEVYMSSIERKQRSVYFGSWQLAMLPEYEDLVLINVEDGDYHLLSSYKGPAPWKTMLGAMCKHYQGDPGFDQLGQCTRAVPPNSE